VVTNSQSSTSRSNQICILLSSRTNYDHQVNTLSQHTVLTNKLGSELTSCHIHSHSCHLPHSHRYNSGTNKVTFGTFIQISFNQMKCSSTVSWILQRLKVQCIKTNCAEKNYLQRCTTTTTVIKHNWPMHKYQHHHKHWKTSGTLSKNIWLH